MLERVAASGSSRITPATFASDFLSFGSAALMVVSNGVSVVMVGHVTKDGALAGPRAIEHLVDTVLSFGGDRSGELRYLRAVKHRYGPTTEVGLFEMTPAGLGPVHPAALAQHRRRVLDYGAAVAHSHRQQTAHLVPAARQLGISPPTKPMISA